MEKVQADRRLCCELITLSDRRRGRLRISQQPPPILGRGEGRTASSASFPRLGMPGAKSFLSESMFVGPERTELSKRGGAGSNLGGSAPARRAKFTPMFHKTSRASLIFLRRAVSFRRLRISTDTPPPELLALHKNLRRNHFLLL